MSPCSSQPPGIRSIRPWPDRMPSAVVTDGRRAPTRAASVLWVSGTGEADAVRRDLAPAHRELAEDEQQAVGDRRQLGDREAAGERLRAAGVTRADGLGDGRPATARAREACVEHGDANRRVHAPGRGGEAVRAVLVPWAKDVARAEQLGRAAPGEADLAAEHAGEQDEADQEREREIVRRTPEPGVERDGGDDECPARDRTVFLGHAGHEVRVSVEQ